MPDYDAMTKAELAAALEKKLSKHELRNLVAWHVEGRTPEGGPTGGDAGSVEASNRWKNPE